MRILRVTLVDSQQAALPTSWSNKAELTSSALLSICHILYHSDCLGIRGPPLRCLLGLLAHYPNAGGYSRYLLQTIPGYVREMNSPCCL